MTTTQTSLAGHRLAAGTVVVYSPYLLHRRSSTFSHPDRFDPDRWTGDNLARSPQGAFVPFGGGARKCIGESFAMVEAVLALATIAARWRFTATRDATVRPALGLALSPNGLHMRITARP
jgi:pentalenene oxygenase